MLTDRDLAAFRDTYLEDSFVLSVTEDADRLVIGVELVLLPGHPLYREPKPGEVRWWEPASIVFAPVTAVRWVRRTDTVIHDPDGSVDLGGLDGIVQTGPAEWRVEGTFGVVVVASPQPVVTYP